MNDSPSSLRAALAELSPKKKYLIGVSGGRDSMVLLHVLHEAGFRRLVVCHLHHGLRGREATQDAALVKKTARKLGQTCETERVDVAKVARRTHSSVELAAREARLNFFTRCARTHRCTRVLLAHHADDQAETCLFNFLRGSGTAGLGGMRPSARVGRLELLRPLLNVSREDIAAYAALHGIPYRNDSSNAEPCHTRNRLRHEVLPAITRAMGASSRNAILRAAEILREEEVWMNSLVPPAPDRLDCRSLRAMPLALRRRLVLRWLIRHEIEEPGFQETERVLSLLNDGSGPAKINLPQNRHARRRAGEIFIEG